MKLAIALLMTLPAISFAKAPKYSKAEAKLVQIMNGKKIVCSADQVMGDQSQSKETSSLLPMTFELDENGVIEAKTTLSEEDNGNMFDNVTEPIVEASETWVSLTLTEDVTINDTFQIKFYQEEGQTPELAGAGVYLQTNEASQIMNVMPLFCELK